MPFVQGKCESCGGILTVDPSLKAANCPFCGSAYIVQDSINYYNTTIKVDNLHADVVNVSDESASDGRLKAADAYMKLARFDQAEAEFNRVIELAPQNYKGWLGKIEAHTQNYAKRIKSGRELNDLAEWVRSFSLFAPTEIKNNVLPKYQAYENSQIQANATEYSSYSDVIQKQKAAVADFEKQIRELADLQIKNNEKAYSLERKVGNFRVFSQGKVIVTIIAIIICLIGFYAYRFNSALGIVLWLFVGITFFILIFSAILNGSRKNKMRSLRNNNKKIEIQRAEISAQIQSYQNAIQSNIELANEYI